VYVSVDPVVAGDDTAALVRFDLGCEMLDSSCFYFCSLRVGSFFGVSFWAALQPDLDYLLPFNFFSMPYFGTHVIGIAPDARFTLFSTGVLSLFFFFFDSFLSCFFFFHRSCFPINTSTTPCVDALAFLVMVVVCFHAHARHL